MVGVATAVFLPVAAEGVGGGSVQGYSADAAYDNGTIVQLTGKDANRVKIAKQAELQNMFGVVVDRNALSVTLSNSGLENEVFVAASGTYNVLVSNQAGPITSGDYVTLSSINGVAMKAGTDEKTVFGRANAPFNGKGITLGTSVLKDTEGKTNKTVTLGSIPVTIDIKSNPNIESTKSDLPEFLQRVGQTIAEKEVSPIRIYLSLGITLISILAAIAILYSGVRNGLISIGRNPMSKKSIFRALLEVILTSVLILIIGLFAVYLLLRL
ncbi:MAG: rane protein of unknown function [Candidatus Saccharibacteria bacterium]|nr:rane protein of unknown function [Candidatus Saccharibacteria bacterium]MDB5180486.1 rane protein of unknown function [Candidatus Saccharibacteria bacterium]